MCLLAHRWCCHHNRMILSLPISLPMKISPEKRTAAASFPVVGGAAGSCRAWSSSRQKHFRIVFRVSKMPGFDPALSFHPCDFPSPLTDQTRAPSWSRWPLRSPCSICLLVCSYSFPLQLRCTTSELCQAWPSIAKRTLDHHDIF